VQDESALGEVLAVGADGIYSDHVDRMMVALNRAA
jgi:hypothetical protein